MDNDSNLPTTAGVIDDDDDNSRAKRGETVERAGGE